LGGKNFILIKSVIGKLLRIVKILFLTIILIFVFDHVMIWLSHVVPLLRFSIICIEFLIILILLRFFIKSWIWILTITMLNPMIMTYWIGTRRICKIMRSHWLTNILESLIMKVPWIIIRIKVSLVWMIMFINKSLWNRIDVIMRKLIGLSCN